jgi:hypothetical protein
LKWTLNTVWYLFLPVLERLGIKKPTRGYVKGLVKVLCEAASVTRESIGIFAGDRAELYFDGEWTSVSFDKIDELAEKGTDLVCIEKEGVPEVLTDWADKYGVALVNTRGHLTEYGKDLMRAAKRSGAHVVIMADYDTTGVKIASESPLDMPWIGVNDATLEYFGLTRETVSIDSDTKANKEYVRHLVTYGEHPADAKNANAGKRDTRFADVDVDFLDNKRVEIDAILAKVGDERFWQYIMDKLKNLYPIRDYNRAIKLPTQYYSTAEDGFDILPDAIKKVLKRIQNIADVATEQTENDIESEQEKVEGFIEVPEQMKRNAERLAKVLTENEGMKVIISKFEELLRPGVLPETKPADDENSRKESSSRQIRKN